MQVFSPTQRRERIWAGAFFLLLAVIGLLSFRDFGIPYDEGTLSQLGLESYAYVFEGKPYPTDPHFRFHGTAVELPIIIASKALGLTEPSAIAGFRRLVVFSFFFLAVASVYALARRLLGDWKIALAGAVFLLLSPRVFAHGFYNSRDIPTMALFALAGLTLVRLCDKPGRLRALVHGIVCGLALGIRMPSLFLIPLTGLFLGITMLSSQRAEGQEGRKAEREKAIPSALLPFCLFALQIFGVFLLAACVTVYAVWPLLWAHPIRHFLDALAFMGDLDQPISFLGRTYDSLPWRYIPGWIAFTTPWLYTALFLTGLVALCVRGIRSRGRAVLEDPLSTLLPIVWFFVPIATLVIGGSVIYQEWRHVLFLYPAFLIVSLHGLVFVREGVRRLASAFPGARIPAIAAVAFAVPLGSTAGWMMRNHPHDYVYYAIPRASISPALDYDYWGMSSRQAVDWIARHDPRIVSIHGSQNIVQLNTVVFFAPHKQVRLIPVKDPAFADYLVVMHEPGVTHPFESQPELYAVTVDGMKLASVHEGYAEAKSFMDDMRRDPNRLTEVIGSLPATSN